MKLLLIVIFVLFTKHSFGLGRVISYDEVKARLFGSIQSIATCGRWNNDERLGEFRVLTIYYAGQEMLFVDIVALDNSGSQLTVVHGFSFAEINNDHAEVGIKTIACKATQANTIRIDATAVNGHNDQQYKFSLVIDGVGYTYQYEESLTHQLLN